MLVQSSQKNFSHCSHKSSEYEFNPHTLKLSNQSTLSIRYIVLIGCFSSTGKFYDHKAGV